MRVIPGRGWLLLPAVIVYAVDVALTLLGQPDAFWQGDYGLAVEGNPLAYPLLAYSPWLFAGAALVWGVLFSAVVLLWHHRAAEWLAVLNTVGHTFGGACWLAWPGAVGWVFAALYLVAVSLGIRWCWRRAWNPDSCSTCRRSQPVFSRRADSSRRG